MKNTVDKSFGYPEDGLSKRKETNMAAKTKKVAKKQLKKQLLKRNNLKTSLILWLELRGVDFRGRIRYEIKLYNYQTNHIKFIKISIILHKI